MAQIALLGGGFIARFYADAIRSLRSRDRICTVYARKEESAKALAGEYGLPRWTTSLDDSVNDPEAEVVIIALPNHLHEAAVMACVQAKKPVLCTKPLGRNAQEALRMLRAVEEAGIFHGYLEDLFYTPKTLKAISEVRKGALGKVLWTRSREAHPGPHSDWFWDKATAGGGAIIDLACHCIEIGRGYIGKDIRPLEVMCWADTLVKPIEAEDNAIGLIRYENGAISQFEVSWTFRGGLDLRDEVMGSEGTIWINNFLRTGFEMYRSGKGSQYVAEKAESNQGWLFPVGDEVHELGYRHMFTDMLDAMEQHTKPEETFYDGYIVNAVMDAAYESATTKRWEPVVLEEWRGQTAVGKDSLFTEYDEKYYLIKEELTHYGAVKLILKDKQSGQIVEKEK
ncbi:Gfo/Idh/MocA family protein [Parapedobacter sp. DT-150]|uniref:Gfo/Idh/MocA family protein n=1 Tax=Parapedobacter sp. DT-150 TaxID=3396162 RepID=UPI003F1AAA52